MTALFKKILKKFLPERAILFYHRALANLAAAYYRFPSDKMIVIGVTGTKGKTSTANYIWSVLNSAGERAAMISTANIIIGDNEELNKFHMTMPGRFALQKLISRAKSAGCKWCIIETTSEGIKQSRHIGINYDIVVLTNLTPEHLASHENSFEKYRDMKAVIFGNLHKSKRKMIGGKKIPKVIFANADCPHASFFLNFQADIKKTFGLNESSDYRATIKHANPETTVFEVNGLSYEIKIPGTFNVYNALPAVAIADIFNFPLNDVARGVAGISTIPGRMEKIEEGQSFTVLVDYAHEKTSMAVALDTARGLTKDNGKVIVLLGAEGGGRDTNKRAEMGSIAAEKADYIVVSNVDPYEDDPLVIADDIARSAEQRGSMRGENLFVILDREKGIQKAISLAKPNDVVILTGKGAEQSITVGGVTTKWDDRDVVRNILKRSGD
ncbi:MAG: UDP-N-acetylmuramyl-tripeptide synthetase [Patescibacteria group bacterium]